MAKFAKKTNTSQEIPTAALPDIIFMLLFFFMVTTVLREVTLMVKQDLPQAIQIQKIKKKSLVSYIYIGEPTKAEIFGTEPKIQVNDVFIETKDIVMFANQEKDKLGEVLRDQLIVSLKVDIDTKMGIVTDVQQELREANARKVLYSSRQTVEGI